MKYSELERELLAAGCVVYKEGANHTLWYSPKTGNTFPVGRHKTQEVPKPETKQLPQPGDSAESNKEV